MPFVASYATQFLTNTIKASTEIGLLDSSGNELSGGGYARHAIGTIDTSIEAQIANKDIIFMFEATDDVGTATQFALYNGNTMIFKGNLTSSLTINDGYVPLIRAHELVIGLDKDYLESY